MSKMNWPPDIAIKKEIQSKEEIEKEGYIEIALVPGRKQNKGNKTDERAN